MTSKTPITPDVITIPRKVDGDILPNIIGLQKDALANALNEIGITCKANKNANSSDLAMAICKRCSNIR
jgi:hypothetical protein